ncbi:MAG: glycerol-3-phosphate 1-O-acyltransferase PlsY [Defluviitaleaceae bacterium]|nr:glycerol-3-phosphate 1-O-acyltransferase PlsY [Defluviitaleaceae bacterium]
MYRLIALLIGYTIGCIQMAYIIGRINGIDIRDHGSKNAGMTNVTRTLGKRAGAFVFVVDILKGVAAFFIMAWLFGGESAFFSFAIPDCVIDYELPIGSICPCAMLGQGCARQALWATGGILPGLYGAIGAVLGHCFPVLLNFRGGKGVSCAIGLILVFDWRVALISYAVGFIAVCITRYISLASLVITLSAAIATAVFAAQSQYPLEAVILMFGLAALIWFLHRENIMRILTGKERKFLDKKAK